MSQEASRARSPRKQPSRPSLGGGTPAQDRELRAQGRETVRRLLEAGMTEFEERGFQGVRVDDVVQRAGISHGTFYLYFSNKEDLFKALLKDALHDMETVAGDFPVVTRDETGHRVLRQWVRQFAKAYAAHGTVLRTLSSANAPAGMFGDGLRLFASIAEAMTTGMTAASRAAGQQQEHTELTAFACLLMLERVNYVISTDEVPLPGEEMADRIADIMYAAFAPVSLRNAAGARDGADARAAAEDAATAAATAVGAVGARDRCGAGSGRAGLGGTVTGMLVADPGYLTLLIGAPAYHTSDFGHSSSAETVSAAVRGVRLALSPTPPHNRTLGIALYVDFVATAQDWADYRNGWVTPPSGR